MSSSDTSRIFNISCVGALTDRFDKEVLILLNNYLADGTSLVLATVQLYLPDILNFSLTNSIVLSVSYYMKYNPSSASYEISSFSDKFLSSSS